MYAVILRRKSMDEKQTRNYYLDFIKLIFTGFVFISHSLNNFANENTWIPFASRS